MDVTNRRRQLEENLEKLDREGARIAREVRNEIVLPLCRAQGLTFFAGAGVYGFAEDDRQYYSGDPHTPLAIVEVFQVLDLEVRPGHYLGSYMEDVTKADL